MNIRRMLYNVAHPKVGEIWCLHRVLPERSAFASNRELEITPDYLEQIVVEKQRQGFRFVDMDAFMMAARGKRQGKKLIHITFDDGFADVFTHAYPVLERYQVPFTLYVTTDMPDGKADLWWLQLEQMADGNADWFEKTMKRVYDRNENMATVMHEITSSAYDPAICQQMSLDWEQIRKMVSEGLCTVGSHGVSHSALSLLSTEEAVHELVASKQRLEEMLGVEIRHFSYPHGFFSDDTNQLVREASYISAVVGYGGATRRKKDNDFFYRCYIVQP